MLIRRDPHMLSDWQYSDYLSKMDDKLKELFNRREMAEFYNTHGKNDHSREKCPKPQDMSISLFDQPKGSYRMQEILKDMSTEKEQEEEEQRLKKESEIKGEQHQLDFDEDERYDEL